MRVSVLHSECAFIPPTVALHEGVVHGNNEDLTGLLELGVADVARDVGAGASRACDDSQHSEDSWRTVSPLLWLRQLRTEGSRNADDDTLALDLLGEIDLVPGGVLNQDVQVGNGIALLNEGGRGVMEEGGLSPDAGEVSSEPASSEHGETQ